MPNIYEIHITKNEAQFSLKLSTDIAFYVRLYRGKKGLRTQKHSFKEFSHFLPQCCQVKSYALGEERKQRSHWQPHP
ncbi:UNVERIFIED_CONTAM: hypothetical protein NCL1_26185 [Trichonephila clavipes]